MYNVQLNFVCYTVVLGLFTHSLPLYLIYIVSKEADVTFNDSYNSENASGVETDGRFVDIYVRSTSGSILVNISQFKRTLETYPNLQKCFFKSLPRHLSFGDNKFYIIQLISNLYTYILQLVFQMQMFGYCRQFSHAWSLAGDISMWKDYGMDYLHVTDSMHT